MQVLTEGSEISVPQSSANSCPCAGASADPVQPRPCRAPQAGGEESESASKQGLWVQPRERKGWSGPAGPEGCSYRLVRGEGRVTRHEEVEPWRGDERGDEADEVVVHVAGVAQGGGAG